MKKYTESFDPIKEMLLDLGFSTIQIETVDNAQKSVQKDSFMHKAEVINDRFKAHSDKFKAKMLLRAVGGEE